MLFDYKLNLYIRNSIFFSILKDIIISNPRHVVTMCFFNNTIHHNYTIFFVFLDKLSKIKFIQTIFIMIIFAN